MEKKVRGERTKGETECSKEALGKSPQGGRTCNLTHGPEPIPLFLSPQTWVKYQSSVLVQGKFAIATVRADGVDKFVLYEPQFTQVCIIG